MSSRDVRAYVADAVVAADTIARLLGPSDLESYRADERMRLAVERELITLGEAIARLVDTAPDLTVGWAIEPRDVVGLRNVLVHGYHKIDDALIFGTASIHVPRLRDDALRALDTLG